MPTIDTSMSSMIETHSYGSVAAPFGDVPSEEGDRLLLGLLAVVPFVIFPMLLATLVWCGDQLDRFLPNHVETEEEFIEKAHRPWRLRVKVWLAVSEWGRRWFYLQILASMLACVMLVQDFYHEGPRTDWQFAIEV